jgi:hypothetical protein
MIEFLDMTTTKRALKLQSQRYADAGSKDFTPSKSCDEKFRSEELRFTRRMGRFDQNHSVSLVERDVLTKYTPFHSWNGKIQLTDNICFTNKKINL